jgi:ceramide glucosyltransferase
MIHGAAEYTLLFLAAVPFIYYLLVIYSSVRFLQVSKRENRRNDDFTPPVSCLKPIKGLDIDAYENYASFCAQDYPEYEIVFCIDPGDPALPVIERLVREFPEQDIRVLFGSGREAVNDKVARLTRLTSEAKYDIFIITDGDVRVGPDYLRAVVSPFRNPKLGAATCLYRATEERTFLENLQSISMASDFFAGILVAWKLDGVKFTLAQSILTTRAAIESFGGYAYLEDRPVDDMQVGRLASENGFETQLLPYVVESVADFRTGREFLYKRVRWMTGMRFMRPWGHAGLFFTWGLPWALVAVAVDPTLAIAVAYLGGYLAMRIIITWLVGARTLKQPGVWKRMPLIPLWDALAFGFWLVSFTQRTIRWRGVDYRLRDGRMIAAGSGAAKSTTI